MSKPYVPITTWINSIWDAVNELRTAEKSHLGRIEELEMASIDEVNPRLAKLEARIAKQDQEIKILREDARATASHEHGMMLGMQTRIDRLETALGPGMYGEYAGGSEGRLRLADPYRPESGSPPMAD